MLKITKKLYEKCFLCSSRPGGNLVDGLPPEIICRRPFGLKSLNILALVTKYNFKTKNKKMSENTDVIFLGVRAMQTHKFPAPPAQKTH